MRHARPRPPAGSTGEPVFLKLALITGALAVGVGGLTVLQLAGKLHAFVDEVLPITGLSALFWAAVTIGLIVLSRRVRRRGPAPRGPGEPMLRVERGGQTAPRRLRRVA